MFDFCSSISPSPRSGSSGRACSGCRRRPRAPAWRSPGRRRTRAGRRGSRFGFGRLSSSNAGRGGELLVDDLVAEIDALVADVDAGAGDQLLDLALRLAAEAAEKLLVRVGWACHCALSLRRPGSGPPLSDYDTRAPARPVVVTRLRAASLPAARALQPRNHRESALRAAPARRSAGELGGERLAEPRPEDRDRRAAGIGARTAAAGGLDEAGQPTLERRLAAVVREHRGRPRRSPRAAHRSPAARARREVVMPGDEVDERPRIAGRGALQGSGVGASGPDRASGARSPGRRCCTPSPPRRS